jgi:hypothetical protein
MTHNARLAASFALLSVLTFPAKAAPVSNTNDFFAELRSCVSANAPAALSDSQVSVRFSVTNKGALIGKPAVSYIKFSGNSAAKNKFISNVIAVMQGCFPIQITSEMGNNIAGQVWNFELSSDPQQDRQETVD